MGGLNLIQIFHLQGVKPTAPTNITLVQCQMLFVSQITFACHPETAMSASVLMEFMRDATILSTLLTQFVTWTRTTQESTLLLLEKLQSVLNVKSQVGQSYTFFDCCNEIYSAMLRINNDLNDYWTINLRRSQRRGWKWQRYRKLPEPHWQLSDARWHHESEPWYI